MNLRRNYLSSPLKRPLRSNTSGFTLIELLLYLGIAAIMLTIISVFLSTLFRARIKNQTISEVEQQGQQVLDIITQTIRSAETINSPLAGSSASLLSLDVIDLNDDPTVFDATGGVIRITEGAGSPLPLTNNRAVSTSLTFSNLSRINTPGTVRIQFTLTHINPEGRNEYTYTKTFYASASLRHP